MTLGRCPLAISCSRGTPSRAYHVQNEFSTSFWGPWSQGNLRPNDYFPTGSQAFSVNSYEPQHVPGYCFKSVSGVFMRFLPPCILNCQPQTHTLCQPQTHPLTHSNGERNPAMAGTGGRAVGNHPWEAHCRGKSRARNLLSHSPP